MSSRFMEWEPKYKNDELFWTQKSAKFYQRRSSADHASCSSTKVMSDKIFNNCIAMH